VSRKRGDVFAKDGLVARPNRPWALPKLAFLDYYAPIALTITEKFRERHYVDLFAGPGQNVDYKRPVDEWEGSPIRMLATTGEHRPTLSFTHATLVNLDPQHVAALEARVERLYAQGRGRVPRVNVRILEGDANKLLPEILQAISRTAYVFVFADITKPAHWPYTSLQQLRSHGHRSLDLYMLLPINMALLRMAPYRFPRMFESALTAFYGTDAWHPIVAKYRQTEAQSPRLRSGLVDLYLDRLRSLGWTHADCVARGRLGSGPCLYEMILATAADVGKKVGQWGKRHASEVERGDQGEFSL
jgi:three-Cys-motif partner protein